MSWFHLDSNCKLTLKLYIQPGAKQTEVIGLHGAALKIKLAAPPVEGKANSTLIAFLAKRFNVPRKHVILKRGSLSRHKTVEIYQPANSPEMLLSAIKIK
ncbi:hypothetical protein Nstercoris_00493 [Nitrosomonas stercoris]|uniref:UPF0235 protein Nstercoris_00493 n=1 Tax=Nitrosomonas stercoris TaxID=1444684 RepID=A0A4Y1YJH1_9PROT|nr:hypothetical protein Nstercoris_00493 [Nitrosomonas stercoris]